MKRTWWKEAVIYQIYPRSFMDSNGDGIGDLQGIISRLDYLKYLGIDVIWVSPVYKSPNDDNGYDISDYQDIMDEFGTMEDFDELLAAAHARGIKIVMDLVVNHTSDEHQWFVESQKSRDNAYRDYYIWREGKDAQTPPNNWGSCFGGSAWQYDEKTGMYYLHLFSKKQPDLNWDNPKVRGEVFDMMTWWCDKGIDGFRMDVISMISKTKEMPDGKNGDFGPYCIHGPNVHHYLREMNEKVLSKYDIMTVGETAGVTTTLAQHYAGEDAHELDMVFQFEHVEGDGKYGKWTDEKIPLVTLKKTLSRWQTELYGKAWNSLFWDNHDQPRVEKVNFTGTISLEGVSGRRIDMELTLRRGDAQALYQKFAVRFAQKDQYHTSLSFRPRESILKIDRKFSGSRRAIIHQRRSLVNSAEGSLKLRIILDRFSAEVFVNDGEQVLTATMYTDQAADGISFFSDGTVEMDVVKYDLL